VGVILVPKHESVSRVPLFPRDSQSHRWPDVGLFQLASFDCLLHSLVCLCAISSFLQSLDSQIVCLPSTIYHWICVYHSTHILGYTQFMEEHILYWPSKLFAHFGNRCQLRRSFREFCGEVFRVLHCFGFVHKHLHLLLMHHWLLHCMVMHNSLYKLS